MNAKVRKSDKCEDPSLRASAQTTELNAIAKALFFVSEHQLKEYVVTTDCQGIADAFSSPSNWSYITMENFSFFLSLYDMYKILEVI